MAAAVPFSFAVWRVLLNNFAIDTVAFNGADMGMLQSLREVPGFLAFTFVLWLSVVREQHFALISLAMLGLGTAPGGMGLKDDAAIALYERELARRLIEGLQSLRLVVAQSRK